jgi:hypothetical protein
MRKKSLSSRNMRRNRMKTILKKSRSRPNKKTQHLSKRAVPTVRKKEALLRLRRSYD